MMPVAMSLAAKSMNMDMDTFMDRLDKGKITSQEFIIPFSNALREMVRESGALDASLKTVQKSRERMVSIFKIVTGKAFEQAKEGFIGFFESISMFLLTNQDGFEAFGKVVSGVFTFLGNAIHIISPLFTLLGTALSIVTQAFDDAFDTTKRGDQLGLITRGLRLIVGIVQFLVGWGIILSARLEKAMLQWEEMGLVGQSSILLIAGAATVLIAKLLGIFKLFSLLKGIGGKVFGSLGKIGVGKAAMGAGGAAMGLLGALKGLVLAHPVLAAIAAGGTALNYGIGAFREDDKTGIDLISDMFNGGGSVQSRTVNINTVDVSVANPVSGSPGDVGAGIAIGLDESLMIGGR